MKLKLKLKLIINKIKKLFQGVRPFRFDKKEVTSRSDGKQILKKIGGLIGSGKIDAALGLWKSQPDLPRNDPNIRFLMGKQQVNSGELAKASSTYQQLKESHPEFPMLNFAMGNVAFARNQYELALDYYADELNSNPDEGLVWLNFGVAHFKLGNISRAKKILLKACDMLDDDFVARVKLSKVYFVEHQFDLAERTLLDLAGFDQDREAMELLVSICIDTKEYRRAIDYIQMLQTSLGDSARVQGYLGFVYQAKGDNFRALEHYTNAVTEDPGDCTAMYNLATLHRDMGRFVKARDCFLTILDHDAEHSGAQWGLSLCLLLAGNYAEGWQKYEQRAHCEDYSIRKFPIPRWTGETRGDLNLLITAEQGLGDEIMFASCVPDLMEYKGKLLLECNPKLAEIFSRSFVGVDVLGHEQAIDNDWVKDYPSVEYTIPTGSLPMLFRKDISSFPDHNGYLKADNNKINYWKQKLATLNDLPKIGISWRGGVESSKSAARSISLQLWQPVLALPCQFISLQYTDCQQEIEEMNQGTGNVVCHWQEAIDDYDETAALIMALDLVVSVQTAVVHLAGSLGAPVIALISAAPEWRYKAEGGTMPWYPSVRLVRQAKLGDWQKVMLEVSDLIAAERT